MPFAIDFLKERNRAEINYIVTFCGIAFCQNKCLFYYRATRKTNKLFESFEAVAGRYDVVHDTYSFAF